ncbi:MAG: site-specific integrase [Solobacterium sp.]|jgi:integrase|nr:site-specific integrase [Solobacterium sp.]
MARKYQNIKQRSNGKYELRFTINGKRHSVYGDTPADCRNKEIQKRQEIDSGITGTNITLNSYFEEFIRQKKDTVKPNTIGTYKAIYKNNIKSEIGNMKLKNIERRHVLNTQRKIAEKVSNANANYSIVLLYSIMKHAVMDGLISTNPADNIPSLKDNERIAARDTIHRALTIDETNMFLDALSNDWLYEAFVFLFTTGCRIGEAGALRWSDIDYTKNMIHICKTITRDADGAISEGLPKTKTSKRDIPMSIITRDMLDCQKGKMTARFGKQNDDAHVFCTAKGNTITASPIDIVIVRALNRMKKHNICIQPFTVHATRDTFATRCIESGMNMNTLKTILGHSSLAMTADLYAHVLPTTQQKEMLMVNTGIVETAQQALN